MTISDLPENIRNRKLLAVEGKEDKGLFVQLLDRMRISDFYVLSVDGKGNFNERLPLLKNLPGFLDITHFAIIRDKDEDSYKSAFDSIVNILCRKMNFQDVPNMHGAWASGPPQIGIFIMPGKTIKGESLEDLCLKTVEEEPAMKCADEFISCASSLKVPPKNLSKAKAQVFLAAQHELASSVGIGAEKGYWDLESSVLKELKEFLSHLK